jgi:hypothetical protein
MTAPNHAIVAELESRLVKVVSTFVRREYISRDDVARAAGSVFRRALSGVGCRQCRQHHVTEISRLIAEDMRAEPTCPASTRTDLSCTHCVSSARTREAHHLAQGKA